ncbi:acyl carrier protein 1, mitochondrial-like isoform X2 [Prosopis cineraria]|uniref:acyl carrier protein 1, mitochondrial-like isoform X2 n=1 Tax=Prosopis cineraria TaxID=364024 RepID=UPI00240FEEDC|nr:acyl carrier protein 1, mitochondrial-like isoform X2 [Prosopis cineraria]
MVSSGPCLRTMIISPKKKSPRESSLFSKISPSSILPRLCGLTSKIIIKAAVNCVNPHAHFQKDLGLDSLDNVEIVMALEEEFKLEIPDKEADKIDSCHLAIEYISNHPMAS